MTQKSGRATLPMGIPLLARTEPSWRGECKKGRKISGRAAPPHWDTTLARSQPAMLQEYEKGLKVCGHAATRVAIPFFRGHNPSYHGIRRGTGNQWARGSPQGRTILTQATVIAELGIREEAKNKWARSFPRRYTTLRRAKTIIACGMRKGAKKKWARNPTWACHLGAGATHHTIRKTTRG